MTGALRKCVSAGEALPKATFDAWEEATGLKLMDGIGATEMLHIFISAPEEEIRPGATGKPVPGYEAKVIGADGEDLPPGKPGRLAVRGPTGCRYLADDRQRKYVVNGWNVTGDTYVRDEDGYFWYQARNDDMIVSAGYNIAGPEVEAALLAHPTVAEAGVVGQPDPERGMIVKAYVVPKPDVTVTPALVVELQSFVKNEIAPYKYPREIAFVPSLPRTETGKLQRFALRERAAREAARHPPPACPRRPSNQRPSHHRRVIRPPKRRARKAFQREIMSQTLKPVIPLSIPDEDVRPVTLNPQGWPVPRGYANGMSAKGRLVVTGGVVGWDIMGNFPEAFVDQARQCFENIRAILAEGGAEPHHVVRLTWYVTDVEEYQANLKGLGRAYRDVSSASTIRPWPSCRSCGWWRRRRRSRSRRRRSSRE